MAHIMLLLDKLSDRPTRDWYASRATSWSKAELAHHIANRLHEREGAAITNFEQALEAGDGLRQALAGLRALSCGDVRGALARHPGASLRAGLCAEALATAVGAAVEVVAAADDLCELNERPLPRANP